MAESERRAPLPMEDERRQTPPRRRRVSRSKRRWRRFVLLYSLAVLLLGAIGLGVLYGYLDAYERSRCTHVMDALLESRSEEDWRQVMLSGQVLELTEFENNEDIINAYFDASCRGQTFSYREASGVSTQDVPVYTIKAGSADVCRVTLQKAAALSFGFSTWQVAACEPYISPYRISTASIRIEAPAGEEVFLNGVAVGESYMTDDNIPCPNLTPLEQRYSQTPGFVRYEVAGLYGTLTVTDGDGGEVIPTDESGMPLYRLGGSGGYEFSVTVPSNASVTVCGVALSDSELAESRDSLLTGLEQYTGGENIRTLRYAVTGLYVKPEITITAPQGFTAVEKADEDGAITVTYAPDASVKEARQEMVEKFFAAYMRYSAGDDSALTPLLSATLFNSKLYNYFAESTAAMYWASDTTINYDYLTFEDFTAWGENCFTCRISYKAQLKSQSWYATNDSTLENTYDVAFVQLNGLWYAAAMAIAE